MKQTVVWRALEQFFDDFRLFNEFESKHYKKC